VYSYNDVTIGYADDEAEKLNTIYKVTSNEKTRTETSEEVFDFIFHFSFLSCIVEVFFEILFRICFLGQIFSTLRNNNNKTYNIVCNQRREIIFH
jgi:hypothetical protein